MKKIILVLTFTLTTFTTFNTYATWSAIAVDRETGEIGIVGASCTFDVQGIASIVPGKGAIVVQASSNYFARMKGVELMNKNSTPEQILAAMRDKKFKPEKQQYGVITLDKKTRPLVYSGKLIKDWNGSKVENSFAVLGNILVGEDVIAKAFGSLKNNRNSSLSERLMLALKAGEGAGGDRRCGLQYARSAFISVYNPENGSILKLSVYGIKQGGQPAVSLLNKQFEKLMKKEGTKK